MPYVATLQSTGTSFALTRRYDGDIPGWGGLREHDEIRLGDLAGAGRSDILIWNARDWGSYYLGLCRQQRGAFRCIRLLRRRHARVGWVSAQRPLLHR